MTDGRDGRKLRSGFTTGACAAAAAKAAMKYLISGKCPSEVSIPFPSGDRHCFRVHASLISDDADGKRSAFASVIKDAGDDPDVTNGAEIGAEVTAILEDGGDRNREFEIVFKAGRGVGNVTRPGLAVPPGSPAINPGPQAMIREAVSEAAEEETVSLSRVTARISVKNGEELAKQTLNSRLGIKGGLSILGTTGIVRPVSAKAWTDTIEASMSVARAAGLEEIILSTGRTSERAVQELLKLREEALVMMGDYLQYSLRCAARYGFSHIHLAGMWAKILKAALRIPQTHVRNGALEIDQAVSLLRSIGLEADEARSLKDANSAREIYERLNDAGRNEIIDAVCRKAKEYAEQESGLSTSIYLVHSNLGVVHKIQ